MEGDSGGKSDRTSMIEQEMARLRAVHEEQGSRIERLEALFRNENGQSSETNELGGNSRTTKVESSISPEEQANSTEYHGSTAEKAELALQKLRQSRELLGELSVKCERMLGVHGNGSRLGIWSDGMIGRRIRIWNYIDSDT
jgi:hypothetical protein